VLGIYYLTRSATDKRGREEVLAPDEVRIAYDGRRGRPAAAIRVRIDGKVVDTTVGRVLLYEVVPKEVPSRRQQVMKKKDLAELNRRHVPELRPEGHGTAWRTT